jgi:hypothetical protein
MGESVTFFSSASAQNVLIAFINAISIIITANPLEIASPDVVVFL